MLVHKENTISLESILNKMQSNQTCNVYVPYGVAYSRAHYRKIPAQVREHICDGYFIDQIGYKTPTDFPSMIVGCYKYRGKTINLIAVPGQTATFTVVSDKFHADALNEEMHAAGADTLVARYLWVGDLPLSAKIRNPSRGAPISIYTHPCMPFNSALYAREILAFMHDTPSNLHIVAGNDMFTQKQMQYLTHKLRNTGATFLGFDSWK